MKKSLSALTATIMAVSCIASTVGSASFSAFASSCPSFYMEVQKSDKVNQVGDGKIQINKEDIAGGLTLTADIFFSDSTHSAWSVAPKWNTDSEFIKINGIHNPLEELTEYAYAEKNENGEIAVVKNEFDYSVNSKYGSHNYTVRRSDGDAMVLYGNESDDYPIVSFDFTIDANTPDGEYSIYFTTDEDNSTRTALDTTGAPIYRFPNNPPQVKNLTITIGEGAKDNLGDINLDGSVDSSDASKALVDYSIVATGGTSTLNAQQTLNGDVNFDGKIDASDASDILAYYAYLSTTTGERKSFREFFKR